MPPEPIEYARRDRWGWVLLVGSLIFVLLGAFLALAPASDARTRWIGAGNVGFFGLCAFVFARDLRRAPISLSLDASGIEYRHPDARQAFRFAWTALAAVRVESEERASLVVLTLRSPEGLPAHAAPDWALARGAWPPLIPPETVLSPAALGADPVELADAVERFRRYYGP